MKSRVLGMLAALILVLAACGDVVEGGGDTTAPATDPDPTEMLQIRSEGGFAPIEFILSNGPSYTLLTNGDLIYAGPTPGIYPGPLLPNYQVIRLSPEQLATVEDAIDDIGLVEMTDEYDDTAASFVADANTEVITLWDEDGAHRYSVYALGIGSDPNSSTGSSTDPRTEAFQSLYDYLGGLSLEEGDRYQPERMRVIAGVSMLDLEDELVDVRPWPLGSEDPATWSRVNVDWTCKTFDADYLESFEDATQVTTWDLNGTEMWLLVRPLLPGEPDCPV